MEIAALVAASIVAWALRVSFIGLAANWNLPAETEDWLANGRYAILAALAVAALGPRDGMLPGLPPASSAAGAVAAIVASYRLRGLIWSVAAGMGTVWLLHIVAGS